MFQFDVNTIKETIIYTRVSTNQQDERGSKDKQDDLISAWCLKNNFKIRASFTDTDHGDNPARPGINNLKEYIIANNNIKFLVVLYTDRFTREFKEGVTNLFFLEDAGVQLVSINEGIIKADGSFESLTSLFRIVGAQEEKRKIAKKVTEIMYEYAMTTNRFLGGSILPWFQLEKTREHGKSYKIIIKNNETWDYYRKVFIDILRYKNFKISSVKNNINYSTLLKWSYMPELAGYRTYGKRGKMSNTYKKGHRSKYSISETKVLPALLTDDELFKLNSMRNNSDSIVIKKYFPYLFTSVSVCKCGGKFAGERIKKKIKSIFYYKCEKCQKRFNAEKIEKKITAKIINDDNLKMINDYEFRIADLLDEITKLEKELIIIKGKESDIIELIGEGLISKDTARNKLQSIKKQIEGAEKEILNIKNNIEKEKEKEITQDHIEILKYLLKNYDEETVNDLKEILNLIFKRIVINDYEDITPYY